MTSDLSTAGVKSATFTASGSSTATFQGAFRFTASPETSEEIDRLAREIHGSTEDVLARAVALLSLAVEARNQGKRVAIVDATNHVDTEITGI